MKVNKKQEKRREENLRIIVLRKTVDIRYYKMKLADLQVLREKREKELEAISRQLEEIEKLDEVPSAPVENKENSKESPSICSISFKKITSNIAKRFGIERKQLKPEAKNIALKSGKVRKMISF